MDDGFQRTVVPLTGTDHREPESARVPDPPRRQQDSLPGPVDRVRATPRTARVQRRVPPRSGSFKFDPHIQQETQKYGFTKRIGEELCEYHRQRNGIRYVIVRPHDFTPWGTDWLNGYGARLLYGGVDRDDVLECVRLAVESLAGPAPVGGLEGNVVHAVRPNAFTESDLMGWEDDPPAYAKTFFRALAIFSAGTPSMWRVGPASSTRSERARLDTVRASTSVPSWPSSPGSRRTGRRKVLPVLKHERDPFGSPQLCGCRPRPAHGPAAATDQVGPGPWVAGRPPRF